MTSPEPPEPPDAEPAAPAPPVHPDASVVSTTRWESDGGHLHR